jgi:cyclic GMP-AMP synthase
VANVDKLLYGAQGAVDLLAKLELQADEQGKLQNAKRKIRDHLRAVIASETKRQFGRQITPRFFTQGSEAYKLLNRRAWMPPQQIDVDDGLYLPMTFVKGNGPAEAATLYFPLSAEAKQTINKCCVATKTRVGGVVELSSCFGIYFLVHALRQHATRRTATCSQLWQLLLFC